MAAVHGAKEEAELNDSPATANSKKQQHQLVASTVHAASPPIKSELARGPCPCPFWANPSSVFRRRQRQRLLGQVSEWENGGGGGGGCHIRPPLLLCLWPRSIPNGLWVVDWNQAFVLSQRREGVKVGWRLGVTGLVYRPNSKSKSVGLELDTGFMDKRAVFWMNLMSRESRGTFTSEPIGSERVLLFTIPFG